MITGYVSSDDEDEFDFGYSDPPVKKIQLPLPPAEMQPEVNYNELSSSLEQSIKYCSFLKAVETGDFNALEDLISEGVPVDGLNLQEWTPLVKACDLGLSEVVQFLLNQGADVNFGKDSFTPLMACCTHTLTRENQKMICASLLLENGADVNLKDSNQKTALMYASENGHIQLVNHLLSIPGILINVQDKNGWTALFYAVLNNYHEIVTNLIKAGAKTDLKDRHRKTALNLALDRNFKKITKIFGHSEENATKETLKSSWSEYLLELPDSSGQSGFNSDVERYLSSFHLLDVKHVSLFDFLNMKDEDLYEIGIKIESRRKKILKSIHDFHCYPWQKVSIKPICLGLPLRIDTAVEMTGTIVKHLTVANASFKYVKSRVLSRKINFQPIEKELIDTFVNTYAMLESLEAILKSMVKNIDKIRPAFYSADYVHSSKKEKREQSTYKKSLWFAIGATSAGYLIYYFYRQT